MYLQLCSLAKIFPSAQNNEKNSIYFEQKHIHMLVNLIINPFISVISRIYFHINFIYFTDCCNAQFKQFFLSDKTVRYKQKFEMK